MDKYSILNLNRIYENCGRLDITRYYIRLDIFKSVLCHFQFIEKALGDSDDEYWKSFLRFFRCYRYDFALTLLPFAHPALLNYPLYERIKFQLASCQEVYPTLFSHLSKLINEFDQLLSEGVSPILEVLSVIKNINGKALLLIKDSEFLAPLRNHVKDNMPETNVNVGAIHFLEDYEAVDELILVGAGKWYPAHIFNSPRASRIKVLCLDWLSDDEAKFCFFSDLQKGAGQPFMVQSLLSELQICEPLQLETDIACDADKIVPVINWGELSKEFHVTESAITAQATCECYLCLLENGNMVFVDADPESKLLAIDFSEKNKILAEHHSSGEEAELFVKRIQTSKIEREMFVLLRTKGSGDYITQVADKLLGLRAASANELQKNWKRLLQEKVSRSSTLKVSLDLLDAGSKIAEEYNVRNWMSDSSIRPRNDQDFMAILKCLGLENDAAKYFDAARLINKAHMKAGFYIRRQLIKQAKQMSVDDFEVNNEVCIDLPGIEAGALTAFKVRAISCEKYKVSSAEINQLKKRADLPWRA
ncbi:MAG: hypothetical protein V1882_01180 [Candidatus Omnitrophota bacterium]